MTEPAIDFAPRDVRLDWVGDLAGTFARVENECAAALLIAACQHLGAWCEVRPVDVRNAVEADGRIARWFSNPFFRPDFDGLARTGAIRIDDDRKAPIALLPPFFEALRPRAIRYREARVDWLAASRWADEGGALHEASW